MRVLVTTFPGQGHFHPVAPIALAMQAAGHEVRVATEDSFVPWVEACGVPALGAGRPEAEVVAAATSPGTSDRAIRQFTTEWVPAFAGDVLRAVHGWPPELIVSEEGEHGGPLIGAVLGVPVVTHSWPAPARPLATRLALTEALDEVWSKFGLGDTRLWGGTYLDCCPPPLQTHDARTIAGLVNVRPGLFDGPPIDPPPWLEGLTRPVVFVTVGTVSLFARPEVLDGMVEAVRSVAGTVVAATGPLAPTAVSPRPGVRVERYVPLSHVLRISDLVVSHGGASTSVACLMAGVPQLVIPQGAPSQARVAAAVAAAGVGASLHGRPFEPASVTAAARELLGDKDVGDRIAAARATLNALPGPAQVAATLGRREQGRP